MGMGGGMFNVPPEKVAKAEVPIVCLEHGKRDPQPKMQYEIKPVDQFTEKPGVAELLTMLGNGAVNQRAAQAAAWHLNNGMSWQQLASKQIHHANGLRTPYFSPNEIRIAMQATSLARAEADKHRSEKSQSSQYTSSSSDGSYSEN